ncbi:MAG TPA: transcriptional regulator [Spirochaetia bacterium]|nr:MAG: hypothetical protein A2Y41_06595 [Spirochaetes bacterium GWB1_36_13]HCL56030.1 transcriptional regulator [Spirochaetia bacterium]
MLKEPIIEKLSLFLKVFSDPSRIKILSLLAEKEQCVGSISQTLAMTQSAVSHQLRILRQSYLVKHRKEGKKVLYSLSDDHVESILKTSLEHILENFRGDEA